MYGDDFDEAAIQRWYDEEENGYFHLAQSYKNYIYSYHALNRLHAFRFLTGRYAVCLAMGCARGDDVAPLAAKVDRFVAIEPAEKWWTSEIRGTPANYMKPTVKGAIPLSTGSVDLVVCLGVLHHIPNATYVFSEMARVLRPGGTMVLREPICTMGDWRKPRPGLTTNERGFPPGWIDSKASLMSLLVVRKAYCCFPLTSRLARLFRLQAAYNNKALVLFDYFTSWLMHWNLHYHRDSVLKKISPLDIMYILRKSEPRFADVPNAIEKSISKKLE